MGELAVGGQEQEAGGVDVQPPDVPEVRRRSRQEVVDRLAPLLVVSGNDITSGLVEEDGRLARLEADRAAVDLDVLAVGVGLRADLGAHAVDGDATARDDVLGCAAAAEAGTREDLLETFFGHRVGARPSRVA